MQLALQVEIKKQHLKKNIHPWYAEEQWCKQGKQLLLYSQLNTGFGNKITSGVNRWLKNMGL